MALREKLGRLVLLEETDVSGLGREYRAARLGPAGLDRLVTVLCFAPAVSSQATATKRLMDEARLAARLQNPGLVRVLGIGRVEQTFYISTELIEGRTLSAIFERCQREAFPFAADHALMVASRVASALEYLHGKKDDQGTKLCHGLVAPSRIVISYDGEVKVKGLGLWPALRETDLLDGSERAYLAPEQAAGGAGDARSDMYAVGLVLLQALTGRTPDGSDPRAGLAEAQVVSVSGESSAIPKLLRETLDRALAEDPASRYSSMAEMRKAIDTLLFSGDFTPTTFDLAFFMHTLFRDDMDAESRAIDEARKASYQEFLEEKPSTAAEPTVPAAEPPSVPSFAPPAPLDVPPAVIDAPPAIVGAAVHSGSSSPMLPRTMFGEAPAPEPDGKPEPPIPPTVVLPASPSPAIPPAHPTSSGPYAPAVQTPISSTPSGGVPAFRSTLTALEPASSGAHAHAHPHPHAHEPAHVVDKPSESGRDLRLGRESTGRDPSLRLTMAGGETHAAGRKGLWLAVAGVMALTLVGVGAWLWLGRRPATPVQPPPLTPEAAAALTRVKELETRLADMEKQRIEAETRAAEEARKKLEAAAAAKGRAVDAAAMQRAQEEARQRARAEQELRTRQELRRLTEAKKADEARIAAEMRAAEAATPAPPPSTAAAAPPTTPSTTAVAVSGTPPTTMAAAPSAPPTQPGALVSASDPKLIPPYLLQNSQPQYPLLARQHGIEGVVDLTALVDETGRVAEVTVKTARPKNVGFEQSAVEAVRKRRYRPGTKDGVPVRVYVTIQVAFKK